MVEEAVSGGSFESGRLQNLHRALGSVLFLKLGKWASPFAFFAAKRALHVL